MKWWNDWRGSLDGRPAMWIRRLLWLPIYRSAGKWRSIRIHLHKFVRADDKSCFHSHPAWAIRIVLWGGYQEEVYIEGTGCPFGEDLYPADHRYELIRYLQFWRPGNIGIVRPTLIHRVAAIVNGRASYSLWIRGPICADARLVGEGWPRST